MSAGHAFSESKKNNMQHNPSELPDFIVKSTQGVALTAILILTPFTINNFLQEWYLLGFFTLLTVVLCITNAYFCFQGKYNLEVNLFGLFPVFMIAIIVALYQLGVAGSYWPTLGIIAFYYMLPEKFAWIVNIIFVAVIAPIGWDVLEPPIAMRFFAVLIGVSFFSFLSIREINKQHFLLKKQAITDSLTGLYNRSLLQGSLENLINQSHRTDTDMTLIMLDIDHFKKINDEHGHDIGDLVLKAFGAFLADYFRATDMVFRLGGEEFIAIIYGADKINAQLVAETLRGKIEELSIVPNIKITVSIGVSCLQANMGWEQWMKDSDNNLYLAKARGRNQVVS